MYFVYDFIIIYLFIYFFSIYAEVDDGLDSDCPDFDGPGFDGSPKLLYLGSVRIELKSITNRN